MTSRLRALVSPRTARPKRSRHRRRLGLLLVVAGLVTSIPTPAHSQAYCALRDPVREIHELYPEATDYRSLVRTVGDAARRQVETTLSFQPHFNELGRHTLYAVLDDIQPLGLVHVRSEKGRWGLVEMAWALDFDLRIVDFRLQRCRDPARRTIEADAFRQQIMGKRLDEIAQLLTPDGDAIETDRLDVPERARPLAAAVLRCALKTSVVTGAVWEDDLRFLRMEGRAVRDFPGAHELERLPAPDLDELRVASPTGAAPEPLGSTGVTTAVVRALDETGRTLGLVVGLRNDGEEATHQELWSVTTGDAPVVVPPAGASHALESPSWQHGRLVALARLLGVRS
ncbi:MAG: hypothetical protein AAF533_19830 [Acidobacteriota bacterium]